MDDKPDFSDTSSTPGGETRDDLIAAAMAHLSSSGSAAFMVPVPGTDPQIYVAAGTAAALQQAFEITAQRSVDPG